MFFLSELVKRGRSGGRGGPGKEVGASLDRKGWREGGDLALAGRKG